MRNGVIAKNEGGGVNFSPGESINLESRNSLETTMLDINSQIRVRKVSPGRNCVCRVRLRYGTRLSHLRGCNDTLERRNYPRGRNYVDTHIHPYSRSHTRIGRLPRYPCLYQFREIVLNPRVSPVSASFPYLSCAQGVHRYLIPFLLYLLLYLFPGFIALRWQ